MVLDFMYAGQVNVAQENLTSFLAVAEELQVKGLSQNPLESEKKSSKSLSSKSKSSKRRRRSSSGSNQTTSTHIKADSESEDNDEIHIIKTEDTSLNTNDNIEDEEDAGQYDYGEEGDTTVVDQDSRIDVTDDGNGNQGIFIQLLAKYVCFLIYFTLSLLIDLDALVEQSMFQFVDDFGVKLWKCKICGKANKDKSNIRRHMEKHFDGFEQKCSECDFVGKTREGLRRHKYRYHKS